MATEGTGPPPPFPYRLASLAVVVLLERRFPVLGERVERLLRGALAADDGRIDPLVQLLQKLGIFGYRPEVLDLEHRVVEGLVVGRGVLEFRRFKHCLVAGVAAELGPLLLRLVLD